MSGSERVNARRHEAGTQIRNFNHGERRTRSQKRVWKTACEWGTEKGSRAEAQGRGGRNTKALCCLVFIRGDSRHSQACFFYSRDTAVPPFTQRPGGSAGEFGGSGTATLLEGAAAILFPLGRVDRRDAPSLRHAAPSAVPQEGAEGPRELPLDKCPPYVGHCHL